MCYFWSYLLIILLSVSILGFLISVFISWSVHREQTINGCNEWGYANWKTFLKYFNNVDWEYKSSWPESRFGKGDRYCQDYFHADIILFNGKGMVMRIWNIPRYWIFKNKLKNKKSYYKWA